MKPFTVQAVTFLTFSLGGSFGLPVTVANAAPATVPGSASASRSWVALAASTDKAAYQPGEPIQVQIKATNTHNSGAYLRFTSGQRFDFSVIPAGKTEPAYTWSADRMFIQSLGSLWLRPGQVQSYKATIGKEMGALPPGAYDLVAHLTNTPTGIWAAPVRFTITKPALDVHAGTDKKSYRIGEPVKIDVAVTNTSAQPITKNITNGMLVDIVLKDASGKPLWNYGANLRFIRVLGDVTWKPGESKTFSSVWNGTPLPADTAPTPLAPGQYQVQAVLQTDPALESAPAMIELVR